MTTDTIFGAAAPSSFFEEGAALSLGTKFHINSTGISSTGARFYCPPSGAGGAVSLYLWRMTDNEQLAVKSVASPVFDSWNSVTWDSPVSLATFTTYQVSYSTPNRYGATTGDTWPKTSPNGLITTEAPGGFFGSGIGALPAGTFGNNNYWADVLVADSGGTTQITSTVDLRWQVANLITSTVDARWSVYNRITSSTDLRWAVYAAITASLDARWLVANRVTATLDARWAVLAGVTASLDLRWAQFQSVLNTLDLRWSAAGRVSSSIDLQWSVANRVTGTLDARWAVLNQISKALDLRWTSYARVVSSTQLLWVVEFSGVPVPSDITAYLSDSVTAYLGDEIVADLRVR